MTPKKSHQLNNAPDDVLFVPTLSTTAFLSQDSGRVRVLVVDNDENLLDIFVALLQAEDYEVVSTASAEGAMQLLAACQFDAILCDIQLPGMDALELLGHVRAALPNVPVILVTGVETVELARQAMRDGASDFILKPIKPGELPLVIERSLAQHTLQHKSIVDYQGELNPSYEIILDTLLSALDMPDTETQGHSERVTAYTMELADKLGIRSDDLYHIERGALLHDIGQIGIPDRILLKPDKLTEDEWKEMRQHTLIGYRMCSRIEMLKTAADIVKHHHERWDGKGYPDGLTGEEIPLGARLFALSDTLDAMTSDRHYRNALSVSVAQEEIAKHAGTQFDPDIVKLFLSVPASRWIYIRTLSAH